MAGKADIYFTEEEEHSIVTAIRESENMTSGEIRVHISQQVDKDSLRAAQQVFADLRMYNTKYRNAVLLHISMASKTFSIYGDKGIDEVVPPNFWESTRDIIQMHFKKGEIAEGICKGVEHVGKIMKSHFPLDIDDKNELADEITYD